MQVGQFPASAANSLIEGYCDDFVSLAAILAQTLEQVSMRGLNYDASRTSLQRIERGMRDLADAIGEMLNREAGGRSAAAAAPAPQPTASAPSPPPPPAPSPAPLPDLADDDFDLEMPTGVADDEAKPQASRPAAPTPVAEAGGPNADAPPARTGAPTPPWLRQEREWTTPPAAEPSTKSLENLWAPKARPGRPAPAARPTPPPPPPAPTTPPAPPVSPAVARPPASGPGSGATTGSQPFGPTPPRGIQAPPLSQAARQRRQNDTLKGSNQTMPLASVFQFLGRTRKSGTMHVHVDGETMAFELVAGCIQFTASDRCPNSERLGELLVELGSTSREAIAPLLERVGVSSGDRLGKLLVDNGVVSNGQVLEALELQVQRRFQRAANHAMANYEFEEGPRQTGDGRIRIAPSELTFSPRQLRRG